MKLAYRSLLVLMTLFTLSNCTESTPLEKALSSRELQDLITNPDYEVQIRYTRIDRSSEGEPMFTTHSVGEDSDAYFYPASTAKLPITVLALQRLNELRASGYNIDANTPFHIYTPDLTAPIALQDSTKIDHKLTIAHLIKKVFLVSDNDAYNYLFDFLGKDYINKELQKKGLSHTQIQHKFLFGADNENTWHYVFLNAQDTVYVQPSIHSEITIKNSATKGVKKGVGYQANDSIIQEAFDFSLKNRIALKDLEGILQRIIFPEVFSSEQQFNLSDEDYAFLNYWMSRTTMESTDPNYQNDEEYYDSYGKFFIYGDRKGEMTDAVRIYNKVGYAYGTLTDVAYIRDARSGAEFFLSASILVNKNGIFNDNQYEYDAIGIPFLAEVGRAVLSYEQSRY